MTTILKLATENPSYPGPGEYSTIITDYPLTEDPMYNICQIVPVQYSPTETINFEVREKKFEVNVQNDPANTSTSIYSLSAFGVLQPDGSTYGN